MLSVNHYRKQIFSPQIGNPRLHAKVSCPSMTSQSSEEFRADSSLACVVSEAQSGKCLKARFPHLQIFKLTSHIQNLSIYVENNSWQTFYSFGPQVFPMRIICVKWCLVQSIIHLSWTHKYSFGTKSYGQTLPELFKDQ